MSKKRSRTEDFNLELSSLENTNLPPKEEVEKTLALVGNNKEKSPKRIPFTTAISPENRATLEAAAQEREETVADLLNKALEHYFSQVQPLVNEDLKAVYLRVFQRKLK